MFHYDKTCALGASRWTKPIAAIASALKVPTAAHIIGRDTCLGHFAQGYDRVLVVLALDSDGRTNPDRPGPVRSQQDHSKRLGTLSMQSSTVTRAMGNLHWCQTTASLLSAPYSAHLH